MVVRSPVEPAMVFRWAAADRRVIRERVLR
jgi:hypothetical protein